MTYFICRIPFGTSELKIKTFEEISDSVAEEISYFTTNFYNELNANIVNSSAHKFNNGQVGIPIFLKKEYLEFLSQHVGLANSTELEYQPFKFENLSNFNLNDIASFDRKSLSVIKRIPFTLESPINRKNFVIDILS